MNSKQSLLELRTRIRESQDWSPVRVTRDEAVRLCGECCLQRHMVLPVMTPSGVARHEAIKIVDGIIIEWGEL